MLCSVAAVLTVAVDVMSFPRLMDLLWSKKDSSDPQLRQFIGASARVCFFVLIELPWFRFLSWVGVSIENI